MIDKIMDVLDGDDSYPMAVNLLEMLEEAGMSPPSYAYKEHIIPGWSKPLTAYRDNWEPEDEKK